MIDELKSESSDDQLLLELYMAEEYVQEIIHRALVIICELAIDPSESK